MAATGPPAGSPRAKRCCGAQYVFAVSLSKSIGKQFHAQQRWAVVHHHSGFVAIQAAGHMPLSVLKPHRLHRQEVALRRSRVGRDNRRGAGVAQYIKFILCRL